MCLACRFFSITISFPKYPENPYMRWRYEVSEKFGGRDGGKVSAGSD